MTYLTDEIKRRGQDTCSLCPNKKKGRGWCAKHYARWWRYGDPNFKLPRSAPPPVLPESWATDGFWEQVARLQRERLGPQTLVAR